MAGAEGPPPSLNRVNVGSGSQESGGLSRWGRQGQEELAVWGGSFPQRCQGLWVPPVVPDPVPCRCLQAGEEPLRAGASAQTLHHLHRRGGLAVRLPQRERERGSAAHQDRVPGADAGCEEGGLGRWGALLDACGVAPSCPLCVPTQVWGTAATASWCWGPPTSPGCWTQPSGDGEDAAH